MSIKPSKTTITLKSVCHWPRGSSYHRYEKASQTAFSTT